MENKAVLVTGANGGIGQYVCHYLLTKGERNIICHFRSGNDKVTSLLKSFDLDPSKHSVQADLLDEGSVEKMSAFAKTGFGGVSRLVNVAGSSTNSISWKLSKTDFLKVINDSLLSTFLCSKAFIPDMRESKFGRIVNFSSIVGMTGMPGAAHYSAAKAGLIGLTKSMALELANKEVTVNAIALGYFNAGLIEDVPQDMQVEIKKKIPVGRFGEEADVGSLVHYLIDQESRFLTGQVLNLNGGQY